MRPIIPDDLRDIEEKVNLGQRLSAEDGMRLYETPDLNAVGYLANISRERLCGNVAWYVRNQHINYTTSATNCADFAPSMSNQKTIEAMYYPPKIFKSAYWNTSTAHF